MLLAGHPKAAGKVFAVVSEGERIQALSSDGCEQAEALRRPCTSGGQGAAGGLLQCSGGCTIVPEVLSYISIRFKVGD